jgi:hypothetical protein
VLRGCMADGCRKIGHGWEAPCGMSTSTYDANNKTGLCARGQLQNSTIDGNVGLYGHNVSASDALEHIFIPLHLRSNRRLGWGIERDPDSRGPFLIKVPEAGIGLPRSTGHDTGTRVLEVKVATRWSVGAGPRFRDMSDGFSESTTVFYILIFHAIVLSDC